MKNFNAHILVVDDDDGIRDLVKQYLDQNNFLVSTAKSAEDALEKVKIIKFDLIVLDIMMPGKSGLEFTNENKAKLNTPIILLTAKGEASERVEGLEVGADDYLPKPFEPKELVLRINNILKKTKKVIKLSANESALGVGNRVKKALRNIDKNISKYPDSKFKELTKTISKKFNLNENKIICGAGSDEIIQMLCTLFLNKNDEVIVPEFSFLMYRIYAKIAGAKIIYSKEINFKASINDIIKKVNKKTKIVLII